jgi:hypothetical protein
MTAPRYIALGMMIGAALVGLLYSCHAQAGTATLTWTDSARYTDGRAITDPVSYSVYQGRHGQVKPLLVSGLHVRSYVVAGLSGGRVCFAVRSVVKGVRSALSNEGCKWVT